MHSRGAPALSRQHGLHSTKFQAQRAPVAAAAARGTARGRAGAPAPLHALGDFLKSMLDFEGWAPRSSKAWRLNMYQPETVTKASDDDEPDTEQLRVLSDRIAQLRQQRTTPGEASSQQRLEEVQGEAEAGPSPGSGEALSDAELAASLGRRLSQMVEPSQGAAQAEPPLTGLEIWELLLRKYGRSYDMSFVKRDLPGMPSMVSLNIMWLHLEQRSFKMDRDQYRQKLDTVAALLNTLSQTGKVRSFLQAPAKSQKGLPRRPVVGTAISIRLDLKQAVVDEWFGRSGY